jgi:hypothetical protein
MEQMTDEDWKTYNEYINLNSKTGGIKMSEQQLDLSQIKGVEGGEGVDLDKYHKKNAKIEVVEVMQVPSEYTDLIEGTQEHHKQWILKVSSEVLESMGEGVDKIDFRASELFNLIQNHKGELTGFPKGEKSNLGRFCRDLKINVLEVKNLQELIDKLKGKEATIKSYEREYTKDGRKQTRTYLKFLY